MAILIQVKRMVWIVVTLVETGLETMTGGRLNRLKDYIRDERFFLTYGDGVSNINIENL